MFYADYRALVEATNVDLQREAILKFLTHVQEALPFDEDLVLALGEVKGVVEEQVCVGYEEEVANTEHPHNCVHAEKCKLFKNSTVQE